MPDNDWQFVDAWLLLAVQMSGGRMGDRHPLRYVIGTQDHINHAIPTEPEVNDAIGRLTAAGLLLADGDELALTPRGCKLFEPAQGGSMYETLDRLETDLAQLAVPDASTGQQLTPGAYDRALADYVAWAGDFIAGMETAEATEKE